MIRPKTQVRNVGARKSLKLTPENPLFRKRCKEIESVTATATQPANTPQKSVTSVSSGSTTMQARTRVKASSLWGFTAEASMASICSVTFMDPSSAPMPAPTRPATTSPVTIGPISWMIENTMAPGSMDFAPKCTRLLRVSRARTVPIAAPARATSGNDFDPISSNCRKISRNSSGFVTAAHSTLQEKLPRSPNHSIEWLIVAQDEVEVDSIIDEPTVADFNLPRPPQPTIQRHRTQSGT